MSYEQGHTPRQLAPASPCHAHLWQEPTGCSWLGSPERGHFISRGSSSYYRSARGDPLITFGQGPLLRGLHFNLLGLGVHGGVVGGLQQLWEPKGGVEAGPEAGAGARTVASVQQPTPCPQPSSHAPPGSSWAGPWQKMERHSCPHSVPRTLAPETAVPQAPAWAQAAQKMGKGLIVYARLPLKPTSTSKERGSL